MKSDSLIPTSIPNATARIREASLLAPESLGDTDFLKVWFAVSYSFPGLHPDDYDSPDSSWPENLQPLAKEAWTRAECGKLSDELIYPSDAQWAGIYDRLKNPTEGEASRRREIHMRYPVSTAL